MNLIGKWKMHSMMMPVEGEGLKFVTVDEAIAMRPGDRDITQMAEMYMDINPDGKVYELMAIPAGVTEEQLKQAVEEEGIILTDDNMMIVGSHDWKTEDGKFMYDTGIHGEMLGEEISSWAEIEEDENGLITIVASKFERIQ